MLPELFFVFDVESFGLHGTQLAVGWVATDKDGVVQDERRYAIDFKKYQGSVPSDNWEWVIKNIPELPITHKTISEIRKAFWQDWKHWRLQGAVMVADCPWPVESRFLNTCVLETTDEISGPYPLLDVASIAYARGIDPLKTWDRNKNELPKHDPLMDARQSAKILLWLMFGIQRLTWK